MGLFNKERYFLVPIDCVKKSVWKFADNACSNPKFLEKKSLFELGYFNNVPSECRYIIFRVVNKNFCEEFISGIHFLIYEDSEPGKIKLVNDAYDDNLIRQGIAEVISISIEEKQFVDKKSVDEIINKLKIRMALIAYREALKKVFSPSKIAENKINESKTLKKIIKTV